MAAFGDQLVRSGLDYCKLFVEPDILHAPAVENAVLHQSQPLDLGLPAGALPHKEDDRAHRVLDQLALDLPHQLLALYWVGLRRLPVDQRIHLGIATGIIARRPTRVILIELVIGIVKGDREVTFRLKQPQSALISLLASGYSPVYPCHVSAREMRSHPIGTGPFKFIEYKPSQSIKVARNQDYWKPGRPYLDGIEYTIIPNRSTAILAFVAGKFDMTFPYEVSVPLVKDVRRQAPQAICEIKPMNGRATLLVTMRRHSTIVSCAERCS